MGDAVEELLTTTEAAALAGFTRSGFTSTVSQGHGPPKVSRGVFRRADVEAWLDKKASQAKTRRELNDAIEVIAERYTAGMTLQQLGAQYRVDPVTIRSHLLAFGVKMRRGGRRPRSQHQPPQTVVTSEQEELQTQARQGICPVCHLGPFKAVLIHCTKKHGVDKREALAMIGLPSSHTLADPDLSARLRDAAVARDQVARMRGHKPSAAPVHSAAGLAARAAVGRSKRAPDVVGPDQVALFAAKADVAAAEAALGRARSRRRAAATSAMAAGWAASAVARALDISVQMVLADVERHRASRSDAQ